MRRCESQWHLRHNYKSPDANMVYSSLAFSTDDRILAAGTTTGFVQLFELSEQNTWEQTAMFSGSSWKSTGRPDVDVTMTDMQFVPISRNTKSLLTASPDEIVLWHISHQTGLPRDSTFVAHGLEFPPLMQSANSMCTASEALMLHPHGNDRFRAVRASYDGTVFGYTLGRSLLIRRVDETEAPPLDVYEGDKKLTQFDFDPTEREIAIVGDQFGRVNLVDMRVKPMLEHEPTMRWDGKPILGSRFVYVNDVKFSPDGRRFFSRHYSDILFWDRRGVKGWPLKHIELTHEGESRSTVLSDKGKDIFRTAWIDSKTIATGSFAEALYMVGIDGEKSVRYINETSARERKNSWKLIGKKERERKFALQHCVHVVEKGKRMIAATNGAEIYIYDFGK